MRYLVLALVMMGATGTQISFYRANPGPDMNLPKDDGRMPALHCVECGSLIAYGGAMSVPDSAACGTCWEDMLEARDEHVSDMFALQTDYDDSQEDLEDLEQERDALEMELANCRSGTD